MSQMFCEWHVFTFHTKGVMSSLGSLKTWLCHAQKNSTAMDGKKVETKADEKESWKWAMIQMLQRMPAAVQKKKEVNIA